MKQCFLLISSFLTMSVAFAQVGINTQNPMAALDIVSQGSLATTKAMRVQSGINEILTVRDDGRVGVGTPSPAVRFDIRDANGEGVLGVGESAQTASQADAGALKYISTVQDLFFSDGTTWHRLHSYPVRVRIVANLKSTVVANTSAIANLGNWVLTPDQSNTTFNASTGVFTAPRDGIYQATFVIALVPGTIRANSRLLLKWVTSGTVFPNNLTNGYFFSEASPVGITFPVNSICSGIFRMNQGATIRPQISQSLGSDRNIDLSVSELTVFENY